MMHTLSNCWIIRENKCKAPRSHSRNRANICFTIVISGREKSRWKSQNVFAVNLMKSNDKIKTGRSIFYLHIISTHLQVNPEKEKEETHYYILYHNLAP